jgi:hypothetical protein
MVPAAGQIPPSRGWHDELTPAAEAVSQHSSPVGQ